MHSGVSSLGRHWASSTPPPPSSRGELNTFPSSLSTLPSAATLHRCCAVSCCRRPSTPVHHGCRGAAHRARSGLERHPQEADHPAQACDGVHAGPAVQPAHLRLSHFPCVPHVLPTRLPPRRHQHATAELPLPAAAPVDALAHSGHPPGVPSARIYDPLAWVCH